MQSLQAGMVVVAGPASPADELCSWRFDPGSCRRQEALTKGSSEEHGRDNTWSGGSPRLLAPFTHAVVQLLKRRGWAFDPDEWAGRRAVVNGIRVCSGGDRGSKFSALISRQAVAMQTSGCECNRFLAWAWHVLGRDTCRGGMIYPLGEWI